MTGEKDGVDVFLICVALSTKKEDAQANVVEELFCWQSVVLEQSHKVFHFVRHFELPNPLKFIVLGVLVKV